MCDFRCHDAEKATKACVLLLMFCWISFGHVVCRCCSFLLLFCFRKWNSYSQLNQHRGLAWKNKMYIQQYGIVVLAICVCACCTIAWLRQWHTHTHTKLLKTVFLKCVLLSLWITRPCDHMVSSLDLFAPLFLAMWIFSSHDEKHKNKISNRNSFFLFMYADATWSNSIHYA